MDKEFGEFDSAAELNKKAAELRDKGEEKDLLQLAKENGLDEDDVYDYLAGVVDELATPLMAATGRIDVEGKDLALSGILEDWKAIILQDCAEDAALCQAVMKNDKHLNECLASLIKFAFENKVQVSDKIIDVTKVLHNGKMEQMKKPLYLGVPNLAEARKLIHSYYLGGED
jgi:hypothetical protein